MPGVAWILFGLVVAGLAVLAYAYTSKRRAEIDSPPPAEESSTDSSDTREPAPEEALPEENDDDHDVIPTPVPPAMLARAREADADVEAHPDIPKAEVIFIDDDGIDDPELGVDPSTPPLLPRAVGVTDRGRRRKRNEDSLLVDAEHRVFVVADGMGGHRGGEIASKLATETMAKAFDTGVFHGGVQEDLSEIASDLARAIQMANFAIRSEQKRQRALDGMGTTLCSVRFSDDGKRMYIGNVGDSRCYRLRAGALTRLTTDHTMAEIGTTGPEADNLSRALGVWPAVLIDVIGVAPQLDDVYLLCSDGLTKMLHDDRIAHVLRTEEDDLAAATRLVSFANAYGGKDNVSVILIRMLPIPG